MAPARQPEVQDGVVSPAKHTPAHQPQGVLALKLCFDWVLRQNIPFGFEETVVLCCVLRGEDAVEVSAAAVLLFELTNNLRAPHRWWVSVTLFVVVCALHHVVLVLTASSSGSKSSGCSLYSDLTLRWRMEDRMAPLLRPEECRLVRGQAKGVAVLVPLGCAVVWGFYRAGAASWPFPSHAPTSSGHKAPVVEQRGAPQWSQIDWSKHNLHHI